MYRKFLTQKIWPLPFLPRDLKGLWRACLINIGLLCVLGLVMMGFSGKLEFFILATVMVAAAGGMIVFLLLTLEHLNRTVVIHQTKVLAFDQAALPLMIVTPSFHFAHKNQKALTTCWWANQREGLNPSFIQEDDKEEIERLRKGLEKRTKVTAFLHFNHKGRQETWQIESTPLNRHTLWECQLLTQNQKKVSPEAIQLRALTLMLNQRGEGIFSLNEKGHIVFCNEKFAKWLGYTPLQMMGVPFSQFLFKPRAKEISHPFEIKGRYDFLTATSRMKSAYLEQTSIPCEGGGLITHSVVYLQPECATQAELKKMLELTPLPAAYLDMKGEIQETNALFREKVWAKEESLQGVSFLDFVAEVQKEDIESVLQNFSTKEKEKWASFELQLTDARESIVSAYCAPLPLKSKKGLFLQFHDRVEQREFTGQLVQSQKMQAVGQLAGGIAHDFNNLLTAMIGFCDLLLLRHSPGDHSFTDVMQIKQNANRAANLVRQLLAFSRQQTLKPKILDITETVTELSAFLRRLLGANVELKIRHARDLGLVLVDQGQFEQVITNMIVNARDALGSVGSITLTTQNRDFKKAKRFGHDVVPAGSYVLVEVEDEGTGIDPDIIDQIFDPFFSTKDVGSGTGLGLSTVYGIVKQTGGFIHVESTLGKGTVFSVYFPSYVAEEGVKADPLTREIAPPHDLTGSHTILLVEDEDAVRLFSARALRSKGYKVIEAIHGVEALEFMQATREKIDLVISDVVMPHMDGPDFVTEMNKFKNPPKVLFISGYTEDAFSKHFGEKEEIHFLSKPFSLADLAIQVKSILTEEERGEDAREQG